MADEANITLAVVNARIWTGESAEPWAEAMAVRGDTIAVVGGNSAVRAACGPQTRVIDGAGRMIVPGFIDSHVHFLEGGMRLSGVQLRDARSREEFARRIQAFAATVPPGTWILGGDWDHQQWGGELPTREWIDRVTPRHPVWANRLDGHMALANSLALQAAGVTRETKDVSGGTIVRDAHGEPTGLLKDNAMALVERVVPPPSPEQQDRALEAAMKHVAARGVTSVHHMGSWEDLEVFERAHRSGALRTRIYAAVPLATWPRLAERVRQSGRGDHWLRIGGLKGFVDGSLGSHTAAFIEPYTDLSSDTGLLVETEQNLYANTAGATRAGLHVMIHAIGDRANRMLLDIYERARRELDPADPRFRIEHAQHLAPQDIPRFKALGVIASMQPYHAIDDGRWAERLIGARRAETTYAFRSLLDSGARLAFGSDWYVAPATPLEGLYAAVNRRTLDGKNPAGWVPAQKIKAEEALRAYTLDAAYASFEEKTKGSLVVGKLADFVLLDWNLIEVAPEQLGAARVVVTVAGGKVVHETQ